MKLPSKETTCLHDFTYTLLSHFVAFVGPKSFATIVFQSEVFLGAVRLSFEDASMKQYFVAIKLLNHEAMERFEVSCSKVVVKLFQMSECHFIEKKRGNFEQQVYLYGSSTEFRELFSGIIANHVVRFNVFRGLPF